MPLTRREALQGVAGAAAAAMLQLRAAGKRVEKGAAIPWAQDASHKDRMRAFNDDWHFQRGDSPGAEAVGFDDSAWRVLDVPHDWSIEDLPVATDKGKGAIWTDGTNPVSAGPFDVYASE